MITITIDDREVKAALKRLQARMADMTPVMRAIATELEARALERFETLRDPAGRPWKPLSPVTLARKKGRGSILYQTGDLSESITSRAGRDYAEIGVSGRVPYAAIHQFGGRAGRGRKVNIPARPYLPIASSGQWLGTGDRDVVLDILRQAIDKAARG